MQAAPDGDALKIRTQARSGLRTMPDPAEASAYRLSIQGWRALVRGDLVDADRALTQSQALRPQDPVTRYRRARLLIARNNAAAALPILESIIRARPTTAPTIHASACLDAARLYEQRGLQDQALDLYRAAGDVFGGGQPIKEAAQRAIARLTSAPSSRPR
jgi:tetratricopeptide (TPR) repeat protein